MSVALTLCRRPQREQTLAALLTIANAAARNLQMVNESPGQGKPTLDTVLAYAQDQVNHYLGKHGRDLPHEQKEEVEQIAMTRVIEAYPRIDPTRGWKSFIQWHASGAVLDYIRDGRGFEESGWDEKDPDAADAETGAAPDAAPIEPQQQKRPVLRHRVSEVGGRGGEGDALVNVEDIAAIYGVAIAADGDDALIQPNWDLVARLARADEDVHLIAKLLMGCTQTELQEDFGVSRERLHQRINEFFDRLDSPKHIYDVTVNQIIFAFGMGDLFHMDARDNGWGWDLEPVDLYSQRSVRDARPQLGFNFAL
jgi:DNA-directed RNA polymerase specialized sigma24 family protein